MSFYEFIGSKYGFVAGLFAIHLLVMIYAVIKKQPKNEAALYDDETRS